MVIKPQVPNSSFLSVEKDLNLIISKMLKNERLKRLVYYTSRDALDRPNIGEDATLELFGKNVNLIPKMVVDEKVLNYIFVGFDNFEPSENPEFRGNLITFDIVCHYNQWALKDFALRPYKIAAEIDTMFNNQRLTGIGKLQFLGANYIAMSDEYGCLTLMYAALHGGEDKKNMPNPQDEDQFLQDWADYISED